MKREIFKKMNSDNLFSFDNNAKYELDSNTSDWYLVGG